MVASFHRRKTFPLGQKIVIRRSSGGRAPRRWSSDVSAQPRRQRLQQHWVTPSNDQFESSGNRRSSCGAAKIWAETGPDHPPGGPPPDHEHLARRKSYTAVERCHHHGALHETLRQKQNVGTTAAFLSCRMQAKCFSRWWSLGDSQGEYCETKGMLSENRAVFARTDRPHIPCLLCADYRS